ncbi:MAG: hypothetical protein ABW098_08120 [Candidatus Thiodiazotropha sp.]
MHGYATKIDSMAPEIYRYLNFDKMDDYVEYAMPQAAITDQLPHRSVYKSYRSQQPLLSDCDACGCAKHYGNVDS